MNKVFVIAALCMAAQSALAESDPRIVNGVPVTSSEFRDFTVQMVWGGSTCGGSMISGRYMLTAAHCVYPAASGNVDIYYGSPFAANTTLTTAPASAVVPHPGYSDVDDVIDGLYYSRDIALITLPNPIEQTDSPTLATPAQVAALPVGTRMTVQGWGLDDSGSLPAQQRRAVLSYTTDKSINEQVYADYLFAEVTTGTACFGDSGSGLFVGDTVYGPMSVFIGTSDADDETACETAIADAVASTAVYQDWLSAQINDWGAPTVARFEVESGSSEPQSQTLLIQNIRASSATPTLTLIDSCGLFAIDTSQCSAALGSWESCRVGIEFNPEQVPVTASCESSLALDSTRSIALQVLAEGESTDGGSGGWVSGSGDGSSTPVNPLQEPGKGSSWSIWGLLLMGLLVVYRRRG